MFITKPVSVGNRFHYQLEIPAAEEADKAAIDIRDLNAAKDALAIETSDSEAAKTYVNVIVVKEGNEKNEGVKALVEVLKSDEIKKFIHEKYEGSVVPF